MEEEEDMLSSWDISPEDLLGVVDFPILDTLALPPPPPPPASAFVPYVSEQGPSSWGPWMGGGTRNIHRRMIELMRMSRTEKPKRAEDGQENPAFRQLMRERLRRERLSQCYADLQSTLPYVTKGDKNSIIRSALEYVKELKEVRDGLRKRSEELWSPAVANDGSAATEVEESIKIGLSDPSSAIDTAIAALRRLRGTGLKFRRIRLDFSGAGELVAAVGIEGRASANAKRLCICALLDVKPE